MGAVSGQAQAVESALKILKASLWFDFVKTILFFIKWCRRIERAGSAQIIKPNKLGVEGMVLDLREMAGCFTRGCRYCRVFYPVGLIAFEVGTENNGVFVYQDKDPRLF